MGETPTYPPEPWELRGQAYLSVWRVPARELPPPAGGLRPLLGPLLVGGAAFACVAWVDYQPGSMLPYHELAVAVLVRDGRRIRATVTDIWVDSEPSRAGGRALWGIPKELASFEMSHSPVFRARAERDAEPLASAAFRRRPGLPLRMPSRGCVVQELDGAPRRTPMRLAGYPHPAKASWSFHPSGPMSYLHGRKPLLSVSIRDFTLRFGQQRDRHGVRQ
ncbi:MAG: acetoacetate decarboxylase [Pseudonocardiaceae bacterium]|nr:acetoacetate decarboxylase [Pseudonocardiaceae bacterium]